VIFLFLILILVVGFMATSVIASRVTSRFPPQGRFIDVDGGRLHVIERGPAQPLATIVLLHGASSNAADPMLGLGAPLSERYRVLAFDRPGHGWSARLGGREDASPMRQADLIARALAKEKAGRVIVVAHSLAGAVGTSLALEHAHLVAGLVLLAPVTHPWPGGIAWYYNVAATPFLGPLFAWTMAAPAGHTLMPGAIASVFSPQVPPSGFIDAAQISLVLRPQTFEANAQDMKNLLSYVQARQGTYGAIDMPTTIITGDQDTTVSTDIHARAFAAEVAGAKLIVMPGVGHQPHYASPVLVVAEIDAVVSRIDQFRFKASDVSPSVKP
jgi:pimeloyl-ACP methyl ester carboxylesterase